MSNAKERNKKKHKALLIINAFLNFLAYLLIVIAVIFMILVYTMREENKIYVFFGYSFAVIQSDSMIDAGFNPGDKVVIQQVKTDDLRIDDIILFYRYMDTCDIDLPKQDISDIIDEYKEPETIDENAEIFEERTPTAEILNKKNALVFHKVVGIFVDDYGVRFFQTQGESEKNLSPDPLLIREDLVAGEHCETAKLLNFFLKLTASPWGIMLLMSVPFLILMVSYISSLWGEVAVMNMLKGLRKKKINLNSENFKEYDVSKAISNEEKIFIFDITETQDKQKVANIIWKDLMSKEVSKEQAEQIGKIKYSINLYAKSRDAFWEFWINSEKKASKKRKLKEFREKANSILNPSIDSFNKNIKYKNAVVPIKNIKKGGK
ncbi:MAG: hypothetical protein PHC47_02620 [Clostridia bacterium]|nr:hypothetical protein [Clostridia bacterium]